MKYFLIIIGSLFCLASLSRISLYIIDYNQLTNYGKGYIWGNILLLILGALMLFYAYKQKKND